MRTRSRLKLRVVRDRCERFVAAAFACARAMAFYKDHIYPHLVNVLGDPKPFRNVREQILPMAEGKVLEVGVGPGPNLLLYDPAKVSKIYALEPNAGMIRLAEKQRSHARVEIEFIDLPGERIPLADDAVDSVVSTFTLCTIPDVCEAMRGMRRVLKPGGKFIFFEHGRAPDPEVREWQRRSEPITRFLLEGCTVTRDIPSLITGAGFEIQQISTAYLAPFPKAWTYCFWGTALRSSATV